MAVTPTSAGGTGRTSRNGHLSSLRLAITGGEKCPARVHRLLAEQCPNATVPEGYGVTDEEALQQHFAYEDGPAIAVQVTSGGERPAIVFFTAVDTDRETVNHHIRDAGLSPLHNIGRLVSFDRIPVLGTGKTDYRTLRDSLSHQPPACPRAVGGATQGGGDGSQIP
jgi:acyl-CoA synthetase (AMP-forming)/AMP-acid ligase II